jgi:hypothetical protein
VLAVSARRCPQPQGNSLLPVQARWKLVIRPSPDETGTFTRADCTAKTFRRPTAPNAGSRDNLASATSDRYSRRLRALSMRPCEYRPPVRRSWRVRPVRR